MVSGRPDTVRDEVRERLRDRPVALLSATEDEAGPILAGLRGVEKLMIRAKTFYTGELSPQTPRGASTSSAPPKKASVRVVLAVTGCDKVNAAHALTCLLENMTPAPLLVLQTGIAGAFVTGTPAPQVGDIVLATQEAYADIGSLGPDGWLSATDLGLPIFCLDGVETGGRFPLDARLVNAARIVIEGLDRHDPDVPATEGAVAAARSTRAPAVLAGPFVTSSRVTGLAVEAEELAARWGALAESMEGAAAAHVCALYGIPFLEIRGISNLVVDRDRTSWQVEQAAAVAGRAAAAVAASFEHLPL